MSEKLRLPTVHTAPIVEWRREQGFGFVQLGAARVFLHRREFAEFHKAPEVGDRIEFAIGLDKFGRTCAKSAIHLNDGGKFTARDFLALTALLVLPCLAISRVQAVPWGFAAGYFLAMSVFTYGLYAADKSAARRDAWRVPEKVLHIAELMGGWPGGFVAQRWLRHKCSKTGYLVLFWAIVLVHQVLALDFVLDGAMGRRVVEFFSKLLQGV